MTKGTIRLPQEADDYEGASHLLSERLVDSFGGVTILTDNEGLWRNQKGDIIHETVDIWEVFSNCSSTDMMRELTDIAGHVKEMTGEDVVMVTIDNEYVMVD